MYFWDMDWYLFITIFVLLCCTIFHLYVTSCKFTFKCDGRLNSCTLDGEKRSLTAENVFLARLFFVSYHLFENYFLFFSREMKSFGRRCVMLGRPLPTGEKGTLRHWMGGRSYQPQAMGTTQSSRPPAFSLLQIQMDC